MIEIFGWISMVLAVTGVILNNRKFIFCFWLWMVSNLISAHLHAQVASMEPLYWRDVAFFILAVEGFYQWRKPKERLGYRWRIPKKQAR